MDHEQNTNLFGTLMKRETRGTPVPQRLPRTRSPEGRGIEGGGWSVDGPTLAAECGSFLIVGSAVPRGSCLQIQRGNAELLHLAEFGISAFGLLSGTEF